MSFIDEALLLLKGA